MMEPISPAAMLSAFQEALSRQLKAALHTLGRAMETCPDAEWQAEHGDAPFSQVVFHAPFSQVVFHALFYADFYLGKDALPFKAQPFHQAHSATFADYEELEDRKPVRLYEKAFCREYLEHCLAKVDAAVGAETLESLAGESGIDFRRCSRLELYIYGERHSQHHAAQLGLRVQQATGQELKWYSGH